MLSSGRAVHRSRPRLVRSSPTVGRNRDACLLPWHSAWATSSNFCNFRTANSDAHWADVPTLTRIQCCKFLLPVLDSPTLTLVLRFAPPTQGIASAISTQPLHAVVSRFCLSCHAILRLPEARPASEAGRLLPCVWVACVYPALRRGCKAGTNFWPYDIKAPSLQDEYLCIPEGCSS